MDIDNMVSNNMAMDKSKSDLGKMLRQQRLKMSLTLSELANESGVSPSHLGRIEGGERSPSAHVLRRLARPLGFEENELFVLAGYLPPPPSGVAEESPAYIGRRLDPYVAEVLAQEPVDVQRAVIAILAVLKSLAGEKSKGKQVNG